MKYVLCDDQFYYGPFTSCIQAEEYLKHVEAVGCSAPCGHKIVNYKPPWKPVIEIHWPIINA